MPSLENDRLVFRFPGIEEGASFSIDFQRTLRIPDSGRTYALPPGLGSFPVRHAEDYAGGLPATTAERGGVILPMWQAEAMWINFDNQGPDWDLPFPVSIKIAAGKINAVSGEAWRPGLHRNPQDYLVSPGQPWLDGFAIEPGVIRQFVAMPLGEGYSAEEQLTGRAEWGGLQIQVIPLKAEIWQARKAEWERARRRSPSVQEMVCFADAPIPRPAKASMMGLGGGGRMRQKIERDPFRLSDWDEGAAQRVFVSLVHAKDWKAVTGEPAPTEPPTAEAYTRAGLPWFEWYGADQAPLPGSGRLKWMRSVAEVFRARTGATLPQSGDVVTGAPKALGPGAPRPVRSSDGW